MQSYDPIQKTPIGDLTDNEKLAFSVVADERDRQVYEVYFEMKRCKACNPSGRLDSKVEFRSCWPHVDKMVAIPTRKEWACHE